MHKFPLNVVDLSELLAKPKFANFITASFEQSKTERARELWNVDQYMNKYDEEETPAKDFCPAYFGAAGDWFFTEFLNHYGASKFNICNVRSLTDTESMEKDVGIDSHGESCRDGTRAELVFHSGSPVEIQYKNAKDPTSDLFLNKSRLGNFGSAAAARARKAKKSYSTRLVIVTAARGVHYTVTDSIGEALEVIGSNEIRKLVDGDYNFWNKLRTENSLPPLKVKEFLDSIE